MDSGVLPIEISWTKKVESKESKYRQETMLGRRRGKCPQLQSTNELTLRTGPSKSPSTQKLIDFFQDHLDLVSFVEHDNVNDFMLYK